MTEISIHESGPLFDGRAEVAMREFVRDSEQTIANDAMDMVTQRLHEVIRHPTGYYESHINVAARYDGYAVNDTGIIYGPWLEGTGSRNRTTRFKGYATFRMIAQKIDREAKVKAEEILRKYIRRMQ